MLVSSQVVEEGPVPRIKWKKLTWRDSVIVVEISEFAASDTVKLRPDLGWREHERTLQLEMPANATAPKAFVKVAGAALAPAATGTNGRRAGGLSLSRGVHTLAQANAATYRWDGKSNLLRTALVRAARRDGTPPTREDRAIGKLFQRLRPAFPGAFVRGFVADLPPFLADAGGVAFAGFGAALPVAFAGAAF